MWIETKTRSITKAILWRLVAVTNSFVISWLFFETIAAALGAALAMNVTGLIIYYVYERVWNRVNWGKVAEATAINCQLPPRLGYEKFNGQEQVDIYTGKRMSLETLDQLPKTLPDIPYEEDDDI